MLASRQHVKVKVSSMPAGLVLLGLWFALLVPLPTRGAEPRRVLMINSFGREFAPFDAFAANLHTELVRRSPDPLDFYEVSLDSGRFDAGFREESFVSYLSSLFSERPLDLVVPIGGPAGRFAQKYREQLFPSTPMVLAGVDERHLQNDALHPNDASVAARNEPAQIIQTILHLLPATTNIAVVVGSSPLERFWRTELEGAFQPFTHRVTFEWFDRLTFQDMRNRCAALPAGCAIFYAILAVDAAGVPFSEARSLRELREVASVPIFGLHDTQMGRGIVGGPLLAIGELSRNTAEVALRILGGEDPSSLRLPAQGPGEPQFDWRELRRWNIGVGQLPQGSRIQFRQPSPWERYRWLIISVVAILTLQAASILALLVNRSRRIKAEKAAQKLSQLLIRAHEDERARLARELHDDLTQRVARMAIDLGHLDRNGSSGQAMEIIRSTRDSLAGLSSDIHSLSYRLHPSIVEDLGLEVALKAEAERFTKHESIPAIVSLRDVPKVPPDAGLCLFRVAQESLRNVARHARASSVSISVRPVDGGIQLRISDDGIGMKPRSHEDPPSLGLASMRERVNLLCGEFEVDSTPGEGTTVSAWVPLPR